MDVAGFLAKYPPFDALSPERLSRIAANVRIEYFPRGTVILQEGGDPAGSFYVVRKGHYSIREIFNPAGMYGRWNWRGLLAYVVGFVVMIPFFSSGMYTGPVARALGGADIAMLVGLPVSAGIYLFACRSIDLHWDRQRAAAADIGLDPDDGATAQTA